MTDSQGKLIFENDLNFARIISTTITNKTYLSLLQVFFSNLDAALIPRSYHSPVSNCRSIIEFSIYSTAPPNLLKFWKFHTPPNYCQPPKLTESMWKKKYLILVEIFMLFFPIYRFSKSISPQNEKKYAILFSLSHIYLHFTYD